MSTTREDLHEWFVRGQDLKAAYMIVVCDTFDWEDYPIYVMPRENVEKTIFQYNHKNMQKVMEVYAYAKTWEEQSQGRVWNVP